jgi:hypothetical protein
MAWRLHLEVPSEAADMAEGSKKMMAVWPESGGVGKEEGADRWGPQVSDRKERKRFVERA